MDASLDPDVAAQAAQLTPNYIHPDYATPEQIAQLRLYANGLMQPRPVAHWAQGLAEVADALAGGYLNNKANQQQKAALDFGAGPGQQAPVIESIHPQAPIIAALRGDSGAGPQAGPPAAPQVPPTGLGAGPAPPVASRPLLPPGAYPINDYVNGQVQPIGYTTPDGQSHMFGNGQGVQSGAPAAGPQLPPGAQAAAPDMPRQPPTASAAPPSPYGAVSPQAPPSGGIGSMSPQQISTLLSNPWVPEDTKKLAMALITPQTMEGPLGAKYLYRLGQQPQLLMPGAEKGEISLPGGMKVPTLTTGTPAQPDTKLLIPGGNGPGPAAPVPGGTAPAPGSAAAGPLGGLVPIATQGARLAAQQKGFEDEGADNAKMLGGYKAAGIDAKAAGAQIDALGTLSDRVGYGVTPLIQETLGKFGINTSGLTDIQAFQGAVQDLIPNLRPPGSGTLKDAEIKAFSTAVPGLMTTPEGRRIIVQNLQLLNTYKTQIGTVAADSGLSQDDRIARIQALPAPKLQFSASQSPFGAVSPSSPATPTSQGGTFAPPVAGSRQAPNGNWYVPDPQRPGKWLQVVK